MAWAVAAAGAVAGCGEAAPRTGTDTSAGPAARPALSPGHRRMIGLLAEIRDRTPEDNPYQGDAVMRALEARLASLPADAPAVERWKAEVALGVSRIQMNREREGLAHLEHARASFADLRPQLEPGLAEEFLLRVAAGWLRLAESENCCADRAPESCLLPLRGRAIHRRTEGSRKAVEALDELLDGTAADDKFHLQGLWLRNVAAMTLGEWPDGVPEDRRLPASAFESAVPFPRLENVAAKTGLDVEGYSGSVVTDDFDGDGDLDVMVCKSGTSAQLRYFRNEGDGTFAERTHESGLDGLLGGLNMIQADYDGDGATDVFVMRGAWLSVNGRHPNSLLRNRGDGTFEDVTFDAGLGAVHLPVQCAVWFDYDADGRLDLWVGNETTTDMDAPCQLFRNEGGGRFTDDAATAGVTNDRFTKSVASADFDRDGRPDLYVSNLRGANRLYMNRGDGTFVDRAESAGVTEPFVSFPVLAFDADDDGAQDLLVFGYDTRVEDLVLSILGRPTDRPLPHLYLGDGRGGFREAGREAGLTRLNEPMAANFGDLDGDGHMDFYLGTGTPFGRDIVPNVLCVGLGGGRFAEATYAAGVGHLQKGHGIAFADLDDDGDLDLFADLGGGFPVDRFRAALFENPGSGNHWIGVHLVGTDSNRSAIGAEITAEIVVDGRRRSVHRTVGSGGSFGANPLRQHLGLGKAEKVEVLEISWPTTGRRQTFRDVAADRIVEIVEGRDELRARAPRPVRLGGGPR